jgi:hypothetical protein
MYVIHIDSNNINLISPVLSNKEEFTYSVLAVTCYPGLHLACRCLRLSCGCRLVNPIAQFPSSGIHLYRVCEENVLVQQL